MKLLSFERAFWIAGIIALLILLKRCDNQGVSTAQILTDSLRQAEKQARDSQAIRVFEYNNNMQVAAYRAKQAQDSSHAAWASITTLQAQIRQKRGVLRVLVPSDAGYLDTASSCCTLAGQLADQVDALKFADSLKDAASNEQITLATNMVTAQGKLLDEAHGRYDKLDSTVLEMQESAAKGAVWFGAKTAIGPVSSAGIYTKYQKKNKEYGLGISVQPTGIVYEGMIGIKISFRKKR
jgi:hypothetical protein